jgi:protoheme IX farnesyltransferase
MTDIEKKLGVYYRLTKPGIIYGNILVAGAAFVYASGGVLEHKINLIEGIEMLIGLACIIGSACVFNNYFDRGIDAKMERTKTRGLASGAVSHSSALMFGAVLAIVGIIVLYFFTNLLTLGIALAGFLIYVCLYTPLKPRSPYALFVGAVAGATPPMVGYAAVTNTVNTTAWLLFIFLFVWQLPHFLAIAVYRNEEYSAAEVPMFMKGPYSAAQKKLGKNIFFLSLVVLLAWCAFLAI